jgi:hypothetical protein
MEELADLQADTIALLAGYVEHLEREGNFKRPPRCAGCDHNGMGTMGCTACWPHVEPPIECAREELFAWAVEHLEGEGMSDQIAWLLAWANRRAGNVLERLVEALHGVTDAAATTDLDVDVAAGVVVERPGQPLIAKLAGRIRDMGSTAADALRRAGFPVLPPTKAGT